MKPMISLNKIIMNETLLKGRNSSDKDFDLIYGNDDSDSFVDAKAKAELEVKSSHERIVELSVLEKLRLEFIQYILYFSGFDALNDKENKKSSIEGFLSRFADAKSGNVSIPFPTAFPVMELVMNDYPSLIDFDDRRYIRLLISNRIESIKNWPEAERDRGVKNRIKLNEMFLSLF